MHKAQNKICYINDLLTLKFLLPVSVMLQKQTHNTLGTGHRKANNLF